MVDCLTVTFLPNPPPPAVSQKKTLIYSCATKNITPIGGLLIFLVHLFIHLLHHLLLHLLIYHQSSSNRDLIFDDQQYDNNSKCQQWYIIHLHDVPDWSVVFIKRCFLTYAGALSEATVYRKLPPPAAWPESPKHSVLFENFALNTFLSVPISIEVDGRQGEIKKVSLPCILNSHWPDSVFQHFMRTYVHVRNIVLYLNIEHGRTWFW